MSRLLGLSFCGGLAIATWCFAQEPETNDLRINKTPKPTTTIDLGSATITPTPDMWYYEQERSRYDNPKMAIRRRAEVRAAERHGRLASQRWYGIDNSRPVVSNTPQYGGYAPYWGSNTYDPMRWRGATAPVVVQRPTDRATY